MLIVDINPFILQIIDFLIGILPFIVAFPPTPTAAVAAVDAALTTTCTSAHISNNFFICVSTFI